MGLDNIPAFDLHRVKGFPEHGDKGFCEDCEFCKLDRAGKVTGAVFGNCTWLRGKCYDYIAQAVGDSLYENHDLDKTMELLDKLKALEPAEVSCLTPPYEDARREEDHRILVAWLELLVKWRVGFVAWY